MVFGWSPKTCSILIFGKGLDLTLQSVSLDSVRLIIYTRVSTADQTCENQIRELRALAKLRPEWEIVGEFSDVMSGAKADRPGLEQVMNQVRMKAVDGVLVVKLDRMARSLAHFARMAAEFVKHDVAIIIPGQGIDTSKSNPCGRFQMNILAAVAEFERDLIRERTRAGIATARAKGKQIGRVSTKMPRNPDERAAIVAKWRSEGRPCGYRGLGQMLGGVSASTALTMDKKFPTAPDLPGQLIIPATEDSPPPQLTLPSEEPASFDFE